MKLGTSGPLGKGVKRSTLRVRRSKVNGHRCQVAGVILTVIDSAMTKEGTCHW